MNQESAVLVEYRGSIAIVTLNRPEQRNSMTPELLDSFEKAIHVLSQNQEIRCVILTGKGHCFSAGADFKTAIQRNLENPLPSGRSFAMYQSFLSLLDLQVPIIGALNGHTVGGGFGLSLLCDIRIAHKDAKYGANFVRLGLAPGMAISYTLPLLIGYSRASEMLLTGDLISGTRAAEIGLVNESVSQDNVLLRSMAIAERIASAAPLAVTITKQNMRRRLALEIREAARLESFSQAETVATHDAQEGIAALLEKREPIFLGR